jgi:hypothetical protein
MKKLKTQTDDLKMVVNFKNGGQDIHFYKTKDTMFMELQLILHEKFKELQNICIATDVMTIASYYKMLNLNPNSNYKFYVSSQKNSMEFDYFLTSKLIELFEYIQLRLKAGEFKCNTFKIYFTNP